MEPHDFKLNKVPFSALKSVIINVSRSAAPKLALVPARRYIVAQTRPQKSSPSELLWWLSVNK